MTSLSRGLLLSPLRPLSLPRATSSLLPSELSIARQRLFTTSSSRTAKPQIQSINSNTLPKTSGRLAPGADKAPSQYAFVKTLLSKPSPTTLYQSPPHFWYYFGCWSTGLTILGWTVLTAPAAVDQPEGVPVWVGYTFGASYALLGSMGLFMITKTSGVVNSIRVLPPIATAAKASASTAAAAAAAPAAQRAAARAAAGATASAPAPRLEVSVKRMMPFMQPKVITTGFDRVVMKSRFSLPSEYVPELQRIEAERAEEAKKKALKKFDMEHLLTMPFRRLGRALFALFTGVKSAWTDMGFGRIRVDGKEYKVDVTRGFAHDGFKTLERLVEVNGP